MFVTIGLIPLSLPGEQLYPVLGLLDICSQQPFCNRNERERNVKRVDSESDGNRVMSLLLCSAASDKAAALNAFSSESWAAFLPPGLTYMIQHAYELDPPKQILILSISFLLAFQI